MATASCCNLIVQKMRWFLCKTLVMPTIFLGKKEKGIKKERNSFYRSLPDFLLLLSLSTKPDTPPNLISHHSPSLLYCTVLVALHSLRLPIFFAKETLRRLFCYNASIAFLTAISPLCLSFYMFCSDVPLKVAFALYSFYALLLSLMG